MRYDFPEPEWVILGNPRPVQLEALRRSYYGYKLYDDNKLLPNPQFLHHGPAEGWGHFLEMRLGKTPLMLNEFELFRIHQGITRGIVVAPNTYKSAWVEEAKAFGVELPFFEFETRRAEGSLRDFAVDNRGVLVVNYEALQYKRCRDVLDELFEDKRYVMALDESIKIKNFQSIASKMARAYTKDAAYVRVLTGLPFTQGPHELYPQLRAIKQQDGINPYVFRNRYCKMGGFKNKKVVGVKNEEMLGKLLDECSFVAGLAEWYPSEARAGIYHVERLGQTRQQEAAYDEMEKHFVLAFDSGEVVSAAQVITKLMKQQQIASGFVFDDSGEVVWLNDPVNVPKMQRTLQLLDEAKKAVVFYHYNPTGDALEKAFEKYKPCLIRSDQLMKKRGLDIEAEKAAFNNDPERRVMIAQLERTKYGHDLTGNKGDILCDLEIFYENTYSLDTRSQCEMRIVTADQKVPPQYVDFVTCPADAGPIKALQFKQDIVDTVMDAYRASKNVA